MRGEPGEVLITKSSRLEVLLRGDSLIVRKTALARGESELQAQIEAFKCLPPDIVARYPRLLAADSSSSPHWYEMPFYNFRSMRDHLYHDSVPIDELKASIQVLFGFLFGRLYRWRTAPVTPDFVERVYAKRMLTRLTEVVKQDEVLAEAVGAAEVICAGECLLSPVKQLSRIMDRITPLSLCPPRLCSIHGQLEFDHILLGARAPKESDLILLDTSGVRALSDAGYDIGKLMQSLRCKVDLIKENRFELWFEMQDSRLSASLEFPSPRLDVSNELSEFAFQEVERYALDSGDSHLAMRTEFATAVHLCSALPYYYDPTPEGRKKALAFYVQGARAFHKFSESYLS